MNYIEKYYGGIKSGQIVVSDKVRRVFKHLTEKINNQNSQYIYDDAKAQYAIDFIQTFCKHSKGKWGASMRGRSSRWALTLISWMASTCMEP